jgi:hypothetical protein
MSQGLCDVCILCSVRYQEHEGTLGISQGFSFPLAIGAIRLASSRLKFLSGTKGNESNRANLSSQSL